MSISASKAAAASLLLAGFVSGCSLAPRYARPSAPVAAVYKEAPSRGVRWMAARPDAAWPRGKWWEAFGDTTLDDFEERASSGNENVAAAAESFLAARAVIKQARSQYFPTVTAGASATRSHISATPFGFSSNASFTEYSLPLDASWMPDFWGKVKNQVEANVFAAQASAADLAAVRLSVQTELAVDYYGLRAQDALAVLLDSAAAADADSAAVNRALARAGLVSDQPRADAEAQAAAARAQAADARILRAQYEHAIAVLLGVSPSAFAVAAAPFVPPGAQVPVGVPSLLLQRRPDVAAAERAVAQANAQIGVARAAYFPSLTLDAQGGFESFIAADWLSWPARFWSVGADAGETLFEFGARKAAVLQYRALYDEAVANYRQTALSAFQQVEDDLASVRISSQDAQAQSEAVAAAERNLEEEQARYRAGLDPYLSLLAGRLALLSYEQAELSYESQLASAEVQLIEALGGGWDASRLPPSKRLR